MDDEETAPPPPPDDRSPSWQRVLAVVALVLLIAVPVFVFASSGPRTDVIVISVNGLRADHLSCYGYHRNTTPEICSVAQDGIRYTDATAQFYWTTPSEASIHTGLYPEAHGLFRKPRKGISIIPRAAPALAVELSEDGYNTTLYGAIDRWTFPRESGILRGFKNRHDRTLLPDWTPVMGQINASPPSLMYLHTKAPHRPYTHPDIPLTRYTDWYNGTLRDIAGYETIPYGFLKNVTYSPEDGYVLDSGMAQDPDRRTGASRSGNIMDSGRPPLDLTDDDIQYIRDEYDNMIRHVDTRIGELMDRLREQDEYRSSLIIITSPHGESLAPKERPAVGFGHTISYEEALQVPLIIKPPGNPGPITVDEQVELIDVFPTIMDVLGLPVPTAVQGRSILPPVPDRRYVFSGTDIIQNQSWKLIGPNSQFDEPTLYNMTAPPRQRHNIIGQHPDITSALRDAKADWRQQNQVLHAVLEERSE